MEIHSQDYIFLLLRLYFFHDFGADWNDKNEELWATETSDAVTSFRKNSTHLYFVQVRYSIAIRLRVVTVSGVQVSRKQVTLIIGSQFV